MIVCETRYREVWDYFVFAVAIFAAITVPLRIAFGLGLSPFARVAELGITVVFLADVILNLFN